MTEFVSFTSSTPRHALPLLVAGQAQKEFYVNEALARLDLLLHPVVEAQQTSPPVSPAIGQCFIVASPATDVWEGLEDSIAGWDGQQWTFAAPAEGTAVLDRSEGRLKHFRNGWQLPVQPSAPSGGSVMDLEARATIDQLLEVLRQAGLIAA